MKNLYVFRRFSKTALALSIAIIAGGLFANGAQNPVQAVTSAPLTNASAENDMRMVMHEQELERLDQMNANSNAEQLRATAAAERDLRMVMQELERERLDQSNLKLIRVAHPIDQASITCFEPRPSCDR